MINIVSGTKLAINCMYKNIKLCFLGGIEI